MSSVIRSIGGLKLNKINLPMNADYLQLSKAMHNGPKVSSAILISI